MSCECGATKTYRAPSKSTLHSDWCMESPRFVPKPIKLQGPVKISFMGGTFPMGVTNVLYGVRGVLPPPTVDCELCAKYNAKYPGNVTPKADYSVSYPANFAADVLGVLSAPWTFPTHSTGMHGYKAMKWSASDSWRSRSF